MSTEPKPCPFCGHVGLDFQEGETFRWLEYFCGGCGIGTEVRIQTLGDGTPEEWAEQAKRDAIEEWNRRVPDPKVQEMALQALADEGQARDASVYSVAAPVTPSGAAGEGWINAEERLPQSGQHVLALIWKWDDPTRGRVAVWGCYDSGIWIDLSEDEPYGDAQLHTPTYWLPVPPLPKDESTASGSVSNEAATESTKTTPDAARKSGEAKK
jgi:Lar family restriction alleviation protein